MLGNSIEPSSNLTTFEEVITELAKIADPLPKQMRDIIYEWNRLFEWLHIRNEKEKINEFNAIMKIRVQQGIISLRAPSLDNLI